MISHYKLVLFFYFKNSSMNIRETVHQASCKLFSLALSLPMWPQKFSFAQKFLFDDDQNVGNKFSSFITCINCIHNCKDPSLLQPRNSVNELPLVTVVLFLQPLPR